MSWIIIMSWAYNQFTIWYLSNRSMIRVKFHHLSPTKPTSFKRCIGNELLIRLWFIVDFWSSNASDLIELKRKYRYITSDRYKYKRVIRNLRLDSEFQILSRLQKHNCPQIQVNNRDKQLDIYGPSLQPYYSYIQTTHITV